MMSRRTVFGVLAGGAAALLSGCGGRISTLRYRLTVEVDTPNGVKVGSSVLEDAFNPGNSYEFSGSRRTYGEAPTVDMGGGRYMFVLLSGPSEKRSMQKMISRMFDYPEYPSPVESIKLVDRFAEANDSKPLIVIKPEDYPGIVTFDDINDPKSVREVNLGTVRRMTVQVVDADEPLTEGIEGRLVWLHDYENVSLNHPEFVRGTVAEVPFSQLLNSTNFRWRKK